MRIPRNKEKSTFVRRLTPAGVFETQIQVLGKQFFLNALCSMRARFLLFLALFSYQFSCSIRLTSQAQETCYSWVIFLLLSSCWIFRFLCFSFFSAFCVGNLSSIMNSDNFYRKRFPTHLFLPPSIAEAICQGTSPLLNDFPALLNKLFYEDFYNQCRLAVCNCHETVNNLITVNICARKHVCSIWTQFKALYDVRRSFKGSSCLRALSSSTKADSAAI